MSLQIQTNSISFETPGTFLMTFDFKNTIKDYGVGFKGFDMKYPKKDDHRVNAIGMEITDSYLNGDKTMVNVKVEFALNDNNNDHEGKADVDVVVLADII